MIVVKWDNGHILISSGGDALAGSVQPDYNIRDYMTDDVVGNLEIEHAVDGGPITGLTWKDLNGDIVLTLTGISITDDDFEAGLGFGTPDEGNNLLSYEFFVSLLNNDVTVTGSSS